MDVKHGWTKLDEQLYEKTNEHEFRTPLPQAAAGHRRLPGILALESSEIHEHP